MKQTLCDNTFAIKTTNHIRNSKRIRTLRKKKTNRITNHKMMISYVKMNENSKKKKYYTHYQTHTNTHHNTPTQSHPHSHT